jgi:hypothetical protein
MPRRPCVSNENQQERCELRALPNEQSEITECQREDHGEKNSERNRISEKGLRPNVA